MNSKFRSLLKETGKAVKDARAILIEDNARFKAEQMLKIKESELRELKMRENDMTDFYPESEFSLRVTKKEFDPEKWFGELCNLRVKIANKQIEYEIVKETFDYWFGKNSGE